MASDLVADLAPSRATNSDARLWCVPSATLAILLGVFLALYWRGASDPVAVWSDSRAYNHGFLILPIPCYLIYLPRDRLSGLAPLAYPLECLLPLPACLLLLDSQHMGISHGPQLALTVD